MYHRIADDPGNHWGFAVSPANFEEHLRVLRRTRHPLPLTDFIRKLMAGTLPPAAVALTLDDGYVDNLVAGKPRLAAADVPATVFLATGYLDRCEPFWWDELTRLILFGNGPKIFEVVICGASLRLDLGAEPPARADGTTPASSLTKRREAAWTLRHALRFIGEEERRPIVAKLRSNFTAHDWPADLGRAMTSDEVRALAADGLVTIGAHTVTHPVLPKLETAACDREIKESKAVCESLVGVPVASFAYPYAALDAKVCEAVRAAGFAFACSVQRGPVLTTSDAFALPRIHVHNWDGDAFERDLRSASAAG
jgi:peptidoglycan/xylan/chitin deacetylase (PgdA/CDA1 family)